VSLYNRYIKAYGKVRSGKCLDDEDYKGDVPDTADTVLECALAITIAAIDARAGRDHIRTNESLISEIGKHTNLMEKAGSILVNAGVVWLGDPCFCITPKQHEHPAKDWKEFCEKLEENQESGVTRWPFKAGNDGLGVTISNFGGDGHYPVFVERDESGMIKFVKIVFQPEEE
jgi:hypothetical protein